MLAADFAAGELCRGPVLDEIVVDDGQPGEAAKVAPGRRDEAAGGLQGRRVGGDETVKHAGVVSQRRRLSTACCFGKGVVVAGRDAIVEGIDGRNVCARQDDLDAVRHLTTETVQKNKGGYKGNIRR